MGTPATSKSCIAVGASQNKNNKNDMASFSSIGFSADLRTKPELVAPGQTSVFSDMTSCFKTHSSGLDYRSIVVHLVCSWSNLYSSKSKLFD